MRAWLTALRANPGGALGRGVGAAGLSLVAMYLGRYLAVVAMVLYLPVLGGRADDRLLQSVLVWSEAALVVWCAALVFGRKPLIGIPLVVLTASAMGCGALLATSVSDIGF